MAFDLIFGKTSRSWACGKQYNIHDFDPPGSEQNEYKYISPNDLARKVKDEIQSNFKTAFRLTNDKRLPEVERKNFGLFVQKWFAFVDSKSSRFRDDDLVMLINFRKANQRFTERLAIFDKMASTPLKVPVGIAPEQKALVPFSPPGALTTKPKFPWFLTSFVGLGLGVLGFVFGKKR